MQRIFIDEVGNHDLRSAGNPQERYLALVGIIADADYADAEMTQMLNELKLQVFGTTNVILHRRELIAKAPAPFDELKDACKRELFDGLMLKLFEKARYTAIAILIDKLEHVQRYRVWQSQPYHYCLAVILERYVQWLDGVGLTGDVLIESRGKNENKKLEAAYRRLYKSGTANVSGERFRRFLTSGEIKIKPKSDNIAGLQIVDLLAHPACRDLICCKTGETMKAEFGRKVVGILYRSKYRRRPWDGQIEGWGTKILP